MARTRSVQEECTERYVKFKEYMSKVRQHIISKNYKDALGGDLRGAIENISPILLYDMVPNDALDVLEGRKVWGKGSKEKYGWIPDENPSPISGRKKIERTIPILYNKIYHAILPLRSTHLSITSDIDSITKTYDNLSVYYSDTSYTPHGNLNALDLENTALSAYRQIVQLFDRLHGYCFISAETEELYMCLLEETDLGLPEARILESIAEMDTFPTEEKNKMMEIFSDIKENVLKGVLVLPSVYSGPVVAKEFRPLFNIPWSLIVDYNKNTADGMYSTFSNEEKAFYPEVMLQSSNNDLYIADGKHRHSWLFAEGNNNNYSTIILTRTNSELRRRNSKIVNCIKKTEEYNACNFAFILVHPDFEKISKVIEMLYNDSAYIENFESKFKFYILPENYEQGIIWKRAQEEKDYSETINILNINAMEILSCASEITPLTNIAEKKFTIYSNNRNIEIPDSEMCKYYESGIEFVDVMAIRGKNDWDFYDGAEITWKEIQEGKAIKRQGYNIYLESLKQKISNNRSIVKAQFNYYPGSGATTFLRQIAYDIDVYSKSSANFHCLPIFIKRHEPALLLGSLTKLISIYDGALLVVFESYVLSDESYENLCEELKKQEKHRIYFIRITPTTNLNLQSVLTSKLTKEERAEFNQLFTRQELLSKEKIDYLNGLSQVSAIDYPLLARDSKNKDSYAMMHFVDKMIECLPDEWKEACLLTSFVYKYTGKSTSLSLLKTTLKGKDSLYKWPSEVQKAIKRLLIEVDENGFSTNSWRPRYRVLGECILASYFNLGDEKWVTPSNLFHLSTKLINICSSFTCEINNEDEQILQRMFTERTEEDFRKFDYSEDYLKSFPLVVQDIRDYDLITSIMSDIIQIYPDNPYFLAHYSRYLYEYTAYQKKATENDSAFAKAQDLIEKAVRCNEKSDKVYHMQGTLYNRIIRVFKRHANNSSGDLQQSTNSVKYWMDEAIKAFSASEFYSPLNPFGYMTEGQTIQQGIESLGICFDDSTLKFCDKEPWTEYVHRFNIIIMQLSELIKSSDKDSGSEEMFRRLCSFHIKLIGTDNDSCESYYKKALSHSKTKADRIRFSQLYYWSTIYSVQQRNKIWSERLPETLSLIRGEDYNRMEKVLLHAIQDDYVPAFMQLHKLRLYSDVDYSIEEAIRHWKQCVEKCERLDRVDLSFTLMEAYYMLESYYAAKYIVAAINGEGLDDNDKRQYYEYKEKAINSAHKYNKRGTITSYYYLGNFEDARILIPARDNCELRRKVECQIFDIGQRNGKALVLPCGLEASFGAGKYTRQNIGDTNYWQLGFRYEGIGLYDEINRYEEVFDIDLYNSEKKKLKPTDNDATEVNSTDSTTKESTLDIEIQEYDRNGVSLPIEVLSEGEHKQSITSNIAMSGIKQVGFIDPSKLPTPRNSKPTNKILIDGNEYEGVIVLDGTYKKIKCDIYPYPLRIEDKNTDYYEDEIVIFTAKSRPNDRDASKTFWYAINVRLKED